MTKTANQSKDTAPESRVTIDEVARLAGVAKSTVSKVLRAKTGVSVEKRKKVLSVVNRLDYRPCTDYQRRGRVHMGHIGFVTIAPKKPPLIANDPGAPYLFGMFEGATAVAAERSESISLSRMTWQDVSEHRFPTVINRKHIDGLIIRGWFNDEVVAWVEELSLPVVLLDCDRHVACHSHIRIEHTRTMDEVVQHLLDRGATKFATITGDMNHQNAQERLAGLQMALNRRGIPLDSQAIMQGDFDADTARLRTTELLKRGVEFDALVCQCDGIAHGAMDVLKSKGIRIPDDVRVVGFDNFPFSQTLDPPITTVTTPILRMGEAAARLLYEEIELGQSKRSYVMIEGELIIRSST